MVVLTKGQSWCVRSTCSRDGAATSRCAMFCWWKGYGGSLVMMPRSLLLYTCVLPSMNSTTIERPAVCRHVCHETPSRPSEPQMQ